MASKIILPKSGAELYAICSTALLNAINRNILSAQESVIRGNELLEQAIELNPEVEPIIINGLAAGDGLTRPTFNLADFVLAAKELEMLIGD